MPIVMWILGFIVGSFAVLSILADHSSPKLIGKDRGELLQIKAECEKTLIRQESCKAVITFVPANKQ